MYQEVTWRARTAWRQHRYKEMGVHDYFGIIWAARSPEFVLTMVVRLVILLVRLIFMSYVLSYHFQRFNWVKLRRKLLGFELVTEGSVTFHNG